MNLLVGPWFMEESFWANHIAGILTGLKNPKSFLFFEEDPKAKKIKQETEKIKMMAKSADSSIGMCYSSECCNVKSETIAVYFIQGTITKNSWWMFSTDEFIEQFAANDGNPNVLGHLLVISTGGGEAVHCDLASSLIRSSEKPTFALIDSWCCSGGYYYATACDKIYATSPNDRFGSIGVMMSTIDIRPMYEKEGVKFHDIFATDSTAKNSHYYEIMSGEYDNYRTDVLDPICGQFTGLVKETRPGLVATPENLVLNGKTFYAPQSKEYGLIDGVKSAQEIIQELMDECSKFFAKNNQLFTC